MADISVNIGGLRMKNPVMTASGTFGYGPEFADLVPIEEIGGIIVRAPRSIQGRVIRTREWPKLRRECLIAWDCRTRVLTISVSIFIPK